MEARVRSLSSCYSYSLTDGDGGFGPGVDRGRDVFDRPQRCVFSDSHLPF